MFFINEKFRFSARQLLLDLQVTFLHSYRYNKAFFCNYWGIQLEDHFHALKVKETLIPNKNLKIHKEASIIQADKFYST